MSDLFIAHGDDAPSGENLEYDPDFTAMELAAQPEEERQAGDEIVEGKDPDFKDLAAKARAILERCHDIRAAVYLANAELRLTGLSGFAEMTRYIRFCLEEHWDTCHPQLDADDDDDPTMRINAVTNLSDRSTILRGLRVEAPLTDSRAFGQVTLRDIEVSKGETPPREDETPMPASDLNGAFLDTNDEKLNEFLTSAQAALENVNAVDAVFLEKTPGFGPSLEPLQKMLAQVISVLSEAVGEDEPEATGQSSNAGPTVSASIEGGSGTPGQIASQADVAATLDRIIAYYAKHEPSSPIPILLQRARRLIGADFLTIINDLAPLGVENVNLVGGISEEESY
ncbi:type VI secretion system protein TssA [Marivita hallyeonensis]|uniref:Type VI secretion system protein ImpA n=1 Tax=Marivita hallyeonensis TaxID=996342 RepID=A0A1M5PH85_9RHOB|nr:type VI secretion system protein TssA [Marivita hallyeonensis]SHH01058.1 type VI secretion system protein ImpA [Marivita hallyeonensis]